MGDVEPLNLAGFKAIRRDGRCGTAGPSGFKEIRDGRRGTAVISVLRTRRHVCAVCNPRILALFRAGRGAVKLWSLAAFGRGV